MLDLLVSPVRTPGQAPCLFSDGKQTFSLLLMMVLAEAISRRKDRIATVRKATKGKRKAECVGWVKHGH